MAKSGDDGSGNPPRAWRGRRDWAATIARAVCVMFAAIGVVPLSLGVLVRLTPVQSWAARQTSRLLEQQFHVQASYRLRVEPWPLQLALDDLRVDANDGGSPFFEARRVVVQPRLFALLDGELDVGEIRVEEPTLRVVMRDGRVTNLDFSLPDARGTTATTRIPLAALSLSNGAIDWTLDGLRVRTRQSDIDLTFDPVADPTPGAFPPSPIELSLRSGAVALDSQRADPLGGERVDEDLLCGLDVRARVAAGELLVRRLEVEGALDLDPAVDTRPRCALAEGDWRRLELRASALRIASDDRGIERIEGRLAARLPVPLAHRFADLAPAAGSIEIDADPFSYVRGERLPRLRGRVVGEELGIESKVIADRFAAAIDLANDVVAVSDVDMRWGGGTATIAKATVAPWNEGVPIDASGIRVRDVAFGRLFEALSGNPNAHVAWALDDVRFETFRGTLFPLALEGPIAADTSRFTVFDRPAWQEARERRMGIESARLDGRFAVTEEAIVLDDLAITLPRSRLLTKVSLGYAKRLSVSVREGSTLEFADLSPLGNLAMAGKATVTAEAEGFFNDPRVRGRTTIEDLVIEGFPLGRLAGDVAFEPLRMSVTNGVLTHGRSSARIPALELDFDRDPASVVLTSRIDANGTGVHAEDFFEMLRLERDPLYRDIRGRMTGSAHARLVVGGPEDACGGGRLAVGARLDLAEVKVLGQSFDSGALELDYLWDDRPAGPNGLVVDMHALTLRKGEGSVVGRATIRHDAAVEADFTATAIPIAALDWLGLRKQTDRILPDGTVSGVARIDGTLPRMRGAFDVAISSVRLGTATLPPSRLEVLMAPQTDPVAYEGKSACDHRVLRAAPPASDDDETTSDRAATFRVRRGRLFGGQLVVDDLTLARGDRPMLREGTIHVDRLDLGALSNLVAGVAFSGDAPKGTASGEIRLEQMPLDNPALGEARVRIDDFQFARDGASVTVGKVDQELALASDTLRIPNLPLTFKPRNGFESTVALSGRLEELSTIPRLDLHATLAPLELGRITERLPFVSRAAGLVSGGVHVEGPYLLPKVTGEVRMERGLVRFTNVNLPLDDVNVRLLVRNGEVEIKEASARAGGSGQVTLSGRMPLRGLELAEVNATLAGHDVPLPLADGVNATANALLRLHYQPNAAAASAGTGDETRSEGLPQVTGTVSLTDFTYGRPIALRVDLDQLTGKAKTVVETYDPRNDLVAFDVSVVSPRPLRVVNNLVDASMEVMQPGLRLTGTNQRFGARGGLRLEPTSKLYIQGHDFRVREGRIEFDNALRVTPRLDVTAETEVRRYASTATTTAGATAGGTGSAGADLGASAGNVWRIRMHATGDADSPVVQFSSDPLLSQDDIVLLLQLGMTRAELDRGLASSLAQSVSFEALSALTGFDQALRRTVPLIDEFRLGSQYSSRTGRPEPTVSVGKRITDSLRATVTSGITDNRELRSNIEWRLKRGVSLQGSYDNVNDVSSSTIGNLGADLRWRIEFE